MRIVRFFVACIMGSVLALTPTAQILHVPTDYPTIQDALDAAPARAAVVVHGGTWGPITITRPVTLIGDPPPVIESYNTPPITLAGSGSGQVTLSGLQVMAGSRNCCSHPPPGITGGGFEELHISDSGINADLRGVYGLDGLGYGNSAIDAGVPLLILERSYAVGGGAGIDDACTGSPPEWIPPPAVIGGTVVLLDSGVQGGRNGTFQSLYWPTNAECDPSNCPFLPGGAGIACGTLYYNGSVLPASGGEGARWSPCAGSFCCQSPPGAGVIASQIIALPDDIAIAGIDGRRLTLLLSAPGPLARLLMADDVVTPSLVPGVGYAFLDPTTTRSLGAVATPGTVGIDLPNVLSLIGRTIAFQLIDPTHGYSEPATVAFLLRPQADSPYADTRSSIRPKLTLSFPNGVPRLIGPGERVQFLVTEERVGDLQSGTPEFHFSTGGVFTSVGAVALRNGLYEAVMPFVPCAVLIDFYVTARSLDGVLWSEPTQAPSMVHHATAALRETVAFSDTMETDTGWSVNVASDLAGFSTAIRGTWVRVDPIGATAQPSNDHTPGPGRLAWVTAQFSDVDGGATALRSPILDASAMSDPYISYWRWFSHRTGQDTMTVHISNDGGSTWYLLETVGSTGGHWLRHRLRVANFVTPTSNMRLRFIVADLGSDSTVEAGLDDVDLVDFDCLERRPRPLRR